MFAFLKSMRRDESSTARSFAVAASSVVSVRSLLSSPISHAERALVADTIWPLPNVSSHRSDAGALRCVRAVPIG